MDRIWSVTPGGVASGGGMMKTRLFTAAAVGAILAAAPAFADEGWYVRGAVGYGGPGDTDVSGSLNGTINGQSDLREAAALGYVIHGHKSPKLKLFGRIHTDYWAFPNVDETIFPLESGGNPQDRFNFRRMRLGVSGDLNDNTLYKFE